VIHQCDGQTGGRARSVYAVVRNRQTQLRTWGTVSPLGRKLNIYLRLNPLPTPTPDNRQPGRILLIVPNDPVY